MPNIKSKDKLIKIPWSLRERFLGDPENFMRDVACVSTESVSPFFRRRDMIVELEEKSKKTNNPFNDIKGRLEPDFKPLAEDYHARYMHIDLGLTRDACGISMCHAPYFVTRTKKIFDDGQARIETFHLPFVRFDFIGRIKATMGDEIILSNIREIIYDIASRGFYLNLISYDGFQSVESMQILRSQGYKVARLSIDRTSTKLIVDKHYDKFNGVRRESTDGQLTAAVQSVKDALYDGRLEVPYHEYVRKEMEGAEIDYKKNKVDHKPRGTIDILHTLSGATYNLINNERYYVEDFSDQEYQDQIGDDFYEDNLSEDLDTDYLEDSKDNDPWQTF